MATGALTSLLEAIQGLSDMFYLLYEMKMIAVGQISEISSIKLSCLMIKAVDTVASSMIKDKATKKPNFQSSYAAPNLTVIAIIFI